MTSKRGKGKVGESDKGKETKDNLGCFGRTPDGIRGSLYLTGSENMIDEFNKKWEEEYKIKTI